ncbi:hypothetical protein OF83DRAFT_1127679 [Amylostereum chailletii]|nr:hypothetical protein OF83DRAFT_1127679 [Amylostereum chailletii]
MNNRYSDDEFPTGTRQRRGRRAYDDEHDDGTYADPHGVYVGASGDDGDDADYTEPSKGKRKRKAKKQPSTKKKSQDSATQPRTINNVCLHNYSVGHIRLTDVPQGPTNWMMGRFDLALPSRLPASLKGMQSQFTRLVLEMAPPYNGTGKHYWFKFDFGFMWGIARCNASNMSGVGQPFIWRGFVDEDQMAFGNGCTGTLVNNSRGQITFSVCGNVFGRSGLKCQGVLEVGTADTVYWMDHPKYWKRLFRGINERERARQEMMASGTGGKNRAMAQPYADTPDPIWDTPVDDPERIYEGRLPSDTD